MAFKNKKVLKGKVISVNLKTITVVIDMKKSHPIYKKASIRTKKYYAHDEKNLAKVNDIVVIRECRPLSRTKRFILVSIKENKISISKGGK